MRSMPIGWTTMLLAFIVHHASADRLITPHAQPPVGRFLNDSIEIGRPFQYALTYRHSPRAEVLFPDTARHFAPFRVQRMAVFPTETTGSGPRAVSRDSAVYTLVSFETDSAQLLRVPVRLVNARDCTSLLTPADTVFLRSRLPRQAPYQSLTLAAETAVVPLRQEFNYPVLVALLFGLLATAGGVYALFGRVIRRQWRVYRLGRRHVRFMRDYNQLTRSIVPEQAADIANQAVLIWKLYLERLEQQPYASLTTSEIAERTGDARVADALRETDRMIYGGGFSARSPEALALLRTVAVQTYRRRRLRLRQSRFAPSADQTPFSADERL